MPTGELRYGLVVTTDLENFSKLSILEQAAAQADLVRVLDEAADAAELRREDWYRQVRGDGELAVLPPDTDAAWVISNFTHQLTLLLQRPAGPRLRVRLAMHHGVFTAGQLGPVGPAPIVASRLLDAKQVKAALAQSTEAMVLVVSDQLYRDVVLTEFHGLAPGRFTAIRAHIKHVNYSGHLCVGSPRSEPNRAIEAAATHAG